MRQVRVRYLFSSLVRRDFVLLLDYGVQDRRGLSFRLRLLRVLRVFLEYGSRVAIRGSGSLLGSTHQLFNVRRCVGTSYVGDTRRGSCYLCALLRGCECQVSQYRVFHGYDSYSTYDLLRFFGYTKYVFVYGDYLVQVFPYKFFGVFRGAYLRVWFLPSMLRGIFVLVCCYLFTTLGLLPLSNALRRLYRRFEMFFYDVPVRVSIVVYVYFRIVYGYLGVLHVGIGVLCTLFFGRLPRVFPYYVVAIAMVLRDVC